MYSMSNYSLNSYDPVSLSFLCSFLEKQFVLIKDFLHFSYEMMLECWFESANLRPTFANLVKRFDSFLESITVNVRRDLFFLIFVILRSPSVFLMFLIIITFLCKPRLLINSGHSTIKIRTIMAIKLFSLA